MPASSTTRYTNDVGLNSRNQSTLGARTTEDGSHFDDGGYPSSSREPESRFAEHLNGLFPLQFPPELARRILTHGSHPAAIHGHNAGLSFMGRRVLESYLLLYLSSSPALRPTHDLELIVSRALNTYVLGENVGSLWGLGRALRWTPTVPANKLQAKIDQQALLRNVGLYKVQGDAVAAVVGGIFHQFGGSVAHRVFHTRLLPNLLLGRRPEGLPEVFHAGVLEMAERMGGKDGSLLIDSTARSTPERLAASS
ncbi:hypothetical protein BD779DRAFT_1445729 [Infundibulicybe gibba]|nr:hypothetical protein BD779DRAFT_1445729 [Infundibulicybe gibba]